MRKIEQISISVADRERLERLVRDRNTPQKVVWRARIVLLAGDTVAIAAAVGKSAFTIRRWRRRYVAKGVGGLLKEAPPAAARVRRICVLIPYVQDNPGPEPGNFVAEDPAATALTERRYSAPKGH